MEGISTSKKLDGFIIVTEDWRVFQTLLPLRFNRNLRVFIAEKSKFKGIHLLEGKRKSFIIHLGDVQGLEVYILFSILSKKRVDYEIVLETLKESMEETVSSMQASSTFRDWNTVAATSGNRALYPDDIVEFGNKMTHTFFEKLKNWFGPNRDTQLKTVIKKMGQDMNLDNLSLLLQGFNNEHIENFIFHVATDFKLPNQMLCWSKSKIKTLVNLKFSQQYYVNLMRGVGNFYFDLEMYRESQTCRFVEAKLYSEIFKEMHKTDELPFQGIKIAKDLLSPVEFSRGFNGSKRKTKWEVHNRNVQHLLQSIERVKASAARGLYARCEVIISLSNGITQDLINTALKKLESHSVFSTYNIIYGLEMVPMENVIKHIDCNAVLALNTLAAMIKNRKEGVAGTTWLDNFSLVDYVTAAACEAICCQTAFGNVDYRKKKVLFPLWMKHLLGFSRQNFFEPFTDSDTPFTSTKWLFE